MSIKNLKVLVDVVNSYNGDLLDYQFEERNGKYIRIDGYGHEKEYTKKEMNEYIKLGESDILNSWDLIKDVAQKYL